MMHLILGGARSGKSALAETLASVWQNQVTYVATAQVYDDEFAARIEQHQARRPNHWQLVEEPHFLADTLTHLATPDACIIVDCLTLWLSNHLCADGGDVDASLEQLIQQVSFTQHHLILVSNEVGMGIVPLGEINRQFQDAQGRLNQMVASLADEVSFIAAGLPIKLKG